MYKKTHKLENKEFNENYNKEPIKQKNRNINKQTK